VKKVCFNLDHNNLYLLYKFVIQYINITQIVFIIWLIYSFFCFTDANLSLSYYVDNDSPGSIYTSAGGKGGMVIISGTGTMGQVLTSDGKTFNCGGWGHMFGDGMLCTEIFSIL